MSPELKITFSPVADNNSRDVSVAPQFVSILNGRGLEPFTEAGKNCISPNPPLPPPCVGRPPPKPPPGPCYGGCYGGPPPCYGGRGEMEQNPVKSKDK